MFSHESAAAIWNLPIIGQMPRTVHVVATDGRRRTSANGVKWHTAPLIEGDVVEVEGVLVTSRLRTMVDLARTSTFASAVASLDAGLAHAVALAGTPDAADALREQLTDRILTLGRAPGTARARQAITFASPLAGSPGESFSRVQMHMCGFPAPILQFPVIDRNGTLWHADFGWPRYRTLGEFDGFTKYTRGEYTKGMPIQDIVWAEKKREDLMRGAGFGMARWLWDDARRPQKLIVILRQSGLPCR